MKDIFYTYEHALNSTSRTTVKKKGIYFGKIKHTYKHWNKRDAEQMCIIKVEGNKGYSTVPLSAVKPIDGVIL
jgi:hypothetical protein